MTASSPIVTPRERMLTAMRNEIPDRVPVAPDISNMIPCRLTGKPFWDIYLYQDPPLWRAYIEAARYFGLDGWIYALDGFNADDTDEPPPGTDTHRETVIVEQTSDRIVTWAFTQQKDNSREWDRHVTVYPRADPPTYLLASKIGMTSPPDSWKPIEGVKPQKKAFALLKEALDFFDDDGVIGVAVQPPQLISHELEMDYDIFDYQDRYDEVKKWSRTSGNWTLGYLERALAGPVRSDFILTGGSGMLVFMTPDIMRDLSLPCLQRITTKCKEAGIPSQLHCCGPERELIRMCAEETDLSSINPIEGPPMGDCDLAEIKKSFGARIGLMGNLHTTDVMLLGNVKEVRRAALQAIRDAGENGGFILSSGDQCGRDTPEENIHALVDVVNEFGTYPLDMAAIEREIKRLT